MTHVRTPAACAAAGSGLLQLRSTPHFRLQRHCGRPQQHSGSLLVRFAHTHAVLASHPVMRKVHYFRQTKGCDIYCKAGSRQVHVTWPLSGTNKWTEAYSLVQQVHT